MYLEISIFLLVKGLQIVKGYIPGKNIWQKAKEKSKPGEDKKTLTSPLVRFLTAFIKNVFPYPVLKFS